MSGDSYSEHVDEVRILKRDLEALRTSLLETLAKAEAVRDSARVAVGSDAAAQGEPKAARLIRLWTAQNLDEIGALIRGVDNTNEQADTYLRLVG